VRGHHVDVDLKEIGRPVQAMVAVRLRPQDRGCPDVGHLNHFRRSVVTALNPG
jgi:hypothetical protein